MRRATAKAGAPSTTRPGPSRRQPTNCFRRRPRSGADERAIATSDERASPGFPRHRRTRSARRLTAPGVRPPNPLGRAPSAPMAQTRATEAECIHRGHRGACERAAGGRHPDSSVDPDDSAVAGASGHLRLQHVAVRRPAPRRRRRRMDEHFTICTQAPANCSTYAGTRISLRGSTCPETDQLADQGARLHSEAANDHMAKLCSVRLVVQLEVPG